MSLKLFVPTLLFSMSIILLQLPQNSQTCIFFWLPQWSWYSLLSCCYYPSWLSNHRWFSDFNLHLDNPDDSQVIQFLPALDATNLTQHVSFLTPLDHLTLDLVITVSSSSLSPIIDHSPVSPSDHFPITSTLTVSPLPHPPFSTLSFRRLKSISISKFTCDIANSGLITHSPTNLHDLIDTYNTTLSALLDKHAPLKTKIIRAKTPNLWFSPALAKLKSAKRHFEKV